ncbi:MAG: family 10 glycosylhydrolase [Armatimonadetes bacterium]|nr:family 10 glycosylhydrolase [Armatimonadota bacterium]
MTSLLLYAMLSASQGPAGPEATAMREFRGVWIATVRNIDWPTRPGLSNAELKEEMLTILDRCEDNNLNAIVIQIRPEGDAMYKSDLEPWSYYLTGEQGKAPADGWDPLEFVVEEAHDRGIEVHCWLNPYRAKGPGNTTPLAQPHIKLRKPELVKEYGDYLWMDPGEKEVQDHSYNVFMDVVERYDIDGLHVDDYFYPYPQYADMADFPDGPSWQKYKAGGGKLDRGDWRRKNVNDFIQRVYEGTKERKPWVKFGISPFSLYRPGHPEGITQTSFDQYESLYADCRLWLREGWCDYFTPQLYWPIGGTMSYTLLLDYWNSQNWKNRHMWNGNALHRLPPGERPYPRSDWPVGEVVEQIEYTRTTEATGNVFFSMRAFVQNFKNVNGVLTSTVYTEKALVPATTWLDDVPPPAPDGSLDRSSGLLSLGGATEDARFFAIYADYGNGMKLKKVTTARRTSISGLSLSKASAVKVSLIDLYGNEGQAQTVK